MLIAGVGSTGALLQHCRSVESADGPAWQWQYCHNAPQDPTPASRISETLHHHCVTEAGSATADFVLSPTAVQLDQVVVTGTAGQARRREVGNAISAVQAAETPEVKTDVSSLLQGRIAGASVELSTGSTGAGASIRLRGNTSVALSNQPLIYVDGVRTRSDEYPKNVPPAGSNLRSTNYYASPSNDINPDDIERTQVRKGAAATTLYGTEAAA